MVKEKYFSIIRQGFCFLMAISIVSAASAAKAEGDDSDRAKTIAGHVISVDPENAEIVVTYLDNNLNALSNIKLSVPEDADIVGGVQKIDLGDVQVSDRIEVEFTGDPADNPTVKRLNDLDRTNR